MGREVVVAITNRKLDFGPWEQIFYGEFDAGLSISCPFIFLPSFTDWAALET
jgi:hypothetical protein